MVQKMKNFKERNSKSILHKSNLIKGHTGKFLLPALVFLGIFYLLFYLSHNPSGFFVLAGKEDGKEINETSFENTTTESLSPAGKIIKNLAQYVDYNGRELTLLEKEEVENCSKCVLERYSFIVDFSGEERTRIVEVVMKGNSLHNVTFIE